MATGRVPVHIIDFHLIARECNVNRSMYMSTRGQGFQQTAELYRRFTKSADRLLASSADL